MTILSDLSVALEARIKELGWTQKQAAAQLGVTQPRISDLMRGKLNLFSIDSLVSMLAAAGVNIELSYNRAA